VCEAANRWRRGRENGGGCVGGWCMDSRFVAIILTVVIFVVYIIFDVINILEFSHAGKECST